MFSKEVFKKQNGKVFIIFSIITFICFLYFLYIMFFAKPMDYGNIIGGFLGGICIFGGFLGFPISLCAYAGQEKMYLKSTLYLKNNKIYYSKQTAMHYTVLGKVDEKHLYEINEIESYKITNRLIILYGNFRYKEIYNGNNR